MPNQSSSKEYRAIIFDMDGVIIDSKELVESFWVEKFEQFNLPVPTERFEERFHGRPARLIIEQEFSELTAQQRSEMEKEIKTYDSSVKTYDLIPGIESFLQQCMELQLPMALVTSALPPKVERMNSSLTFHPAFKTIVTADRVKNGKPNPECYSLAIQEMGLNPEETIVFEDSVSGVQAACAAGAAVIGVNEPHLADLLKNAGATFVIENFDRAGMVKKSETAIDCSFSGKDNQTIRFAVN